MADEHVDKSRLAAARISEQYAAQATEVWIMAKRDSLEQASKKMEADAKREDAGAEAKLKADKRESDTEPREAQLNQVEHDTSEQQGRTHTLEVKEEHKAARTQSERFMAKARELGLDEREETFDAALRTVARHKPLADRRIDTEDEKSG